MRLPESMVILVTAGREESLSRELPLVALGHGKVVTGSAIPYVDVHKMRVVEGNLAN